MIAIKKAPETAQEYKIFIESYEEVLVASRGISRLNAEHPLLNFHEHSPDGITFHDIAEHFMPEPMYIDGQRVIEDRPPKKPDPFEMSGHDAKDIVNGLVAIVTSAELENPQQLPDPHDLYYAQLMLQREANRGHDEIAQFLAKQALDLSLAGGLAASSTLY